MFFLQNTHTNIKRISTNREKKKKKDQFGFFYRVNNNRMIMHMIVGKSEIKRKKNNQISISFYVGFFSSDL